MSREISFIVGVSVSILFGGFCGFLPLESFTKIFQTLAAVGAVLVAHSGLTTWRKQLRGETEYKLAHRCLVSVYKLRDALNNVRHPFISAHESSQALAELEEKLGKEDERKAVRAVYIKRWEPVNESRRELQTASIEVEALWGKTAKEKILKLEKQMSVLFTTIEMYLDYPDDVSPEERIKNREIMYAGIKGDFSNEIDESVKGAESILRNYLTHRP